MTESHRQRIVEAAISIARNTRPDRVLQLAESVRTADRNALTLQSLGWTTNQTRLNELLDAWSSSETAGTEVAGILLGAMGMQQFVESDQSLELVWTGPSSSLVPTRKTEQALLEVIRSAERKLFITCFVAYKAEAILRALKSALSLGVEVSMLIESSENHGGTVTIDVVQAMRQALPAARILIWNEKTPSFIGGKVHAKVAVADYLKCFLSSANLTGHAMERNMEAGVLITGGYVPRQLHEHLDSLVVTKVIQ